MALDKPNLWYLFCSPFIYPSICLTQYEGDSTNQLQFLETMIIGNDECRARHNILNRHFVYDNVICTYTTANQGICLGDSGGPLVVQQVLVGVMSWVVPCGTGVPDAYARISSHYDWILQQIVAPQLPEEQPMVEESHTFKFSPMVEDGGVGDQRQVIEV